MKTVSLKESGATTTLRSLISRLSALSLSTRRVLLSAASVLAMLTIFGVATDNFTLTVAAATSAIAIIAIDETHKGGAL